MNSRRTRRFRDALAALPPNVRKQAAAAYQRFRADPYHPSLHFKKVHPNLPIYSARISLAYRAVGIREQDVMIWFWIGVHPDYEKLIAQL